MHLGADLVLETVHQLENKEIAASKQQQDGPIKEAHKLHRETCAIDWNQDITTTDPEPHQLKTGTIVATKNELKVAVKGGFIKILEIQLPGKRKMTAKEVLNGLKLAKNAYVR